MCGCKRFYGCEQRLRALYLIERKIGKEARAVLSRRAMLERIGEVWSTSFQVRGCSNERGSKCCAVYLNICMRDARAGLRI